MIADYNIYDIIEIIGAVFGIGLIIYYTVYLISCNWIK